MSCSDDDNDNPVPVNEEEVITTLRVTLVPEGLGTSVIFESRDLDGDGPDAPVVTVSGDLNASTTYSGTVEVLNELEDPAEDITLEVLDEAEDHQFFYELSINSGIDITYTDQDANGNPIGVTFSLTTTTATVDNTLTITLKHEPNKSAEGVNVGDITNAGGETDVEESFTFDVNN
jgi:hypothetical protein